MLVSQAEDSVLGEAVLQDPTEVLESVSEISEARQSGEMSYQY